MMPRCCIESFASWGIRTMFALAPIGHRHVCETCGRVYELQHDDERKEQNPNGVWTLIEHKVH